MPTGGLSSRQIRELRTAKGPIDPFVALGASWELERTASVPQDVLTVFLAGAECPYTCVFCDLWRHTLDGDTPQGAIPHQIETVLDESGPLVGHPAVKLYNASNFFDPRAVPVCDYDAIAQVVRPFTRVIVENHPKFTNAACKRFADRLLGELEVAIGLETVEPRAHRLLNKGASLDDFDRAAEQLARDGIGLRAFVLLGAPYVAPEELIEWTVRSVEHAITSNARHVSVIPTRGGNGALEHLTTQGHWVPPTLSDLEEILVRCMTLPSIVSVDLWDWERFADCTCAGSRAERLAHMNLTGTLEPAVECDACEGSRA
ncbi:MAG: hypothetical protein V3T56_05805 [Gemmatimonadales bacterium]